MQRIYQTFGLCLFSISLVYSQSNKFSNGNKIPEEQSRELIMDNRFEQGIIEKKNGVKTDATLGCFDNSNPVWYINEINNSILFSNQTPDVTNTGMCRYASNYKDFRFGGPAVSEDYDIYMAINSDEEFGHHFPINNSQTWPAQYLDQSVSLEHGNLCKGPGCPPLSKLKSLNLSLSAKLLYNQTITKRTEEDVLKNKQGYDPKIHCSQFNLFFTVQNLNEAHTEPAFGNDYYWFNVPLYDDRYRYTSEYEMMDITGATGTGKFIYGIPSSTYTTQSIHDGNWIDVKLDILPYVIEGLKRAWKRGELTASYNLDDYKIGGVVTGWEATGRNISTMVLKNLSLIATTTELYWSNGRYANNSMPNSPTTLYPNPVSGSQLTFSGKDIKSIKILNTLGQEMVSAENTTQQNEKIELDLSRLPSGLYFSIIKTDSGLERKSFFKE